ncbi:helix-turn-helix domain-containing protein [Clostridium sp. CS001]|uniref:winged helix-turn-helix domain-containing protein n=1 Tax=Clostridium sp. CS001 TaxID=2880648 RepID=UPI00299D0B42|nr:helix-turn-helix domain-containing protein [Clostridium sp. CS001]
MKEEIQELPPKEFYLIFKLLSYPNNIFTRKELMDEIWGMNIEIDDRTVDSHIKKLIARRNCFQFLL